MATDTIDRPKNGMKTPAAEGKRPKNRGNFANDPSRAREAGRKGGKARGKPKASRS